MKFILGKKMSMTQVWNSDERVVAVTPVQAGPCTVVQVKDEKKNGYKALQLAFGNRKDKNINKPQKEVYKKLNISPSHVKEFRTSELEGVKPGDVVSVGTFNEGDVIAVTGISKGKGFQGVVKRHGFSGFRKTHGNKDQERMPGSIGPKGPARVFKGTKMGGRMGGDRVTVSNLKVVSVDEENNIIYIAGAIPGAVNGLIRIKADGELKLNLKPEKQEEVVEVKEEKKDEELKEVKEETIEEKKEEKVEDKKVEETKEEKTTDKQEEVKEEKKEEGEEKEEKKEETKTEEKPKDDKKEEDKKEENKENK